jgi:hypothetical protein
MRGFDSRSIALAAAFGLFLISAGGAQQPAAAPTPRLADGHPNLNGVWYPYSGHLAPDSSKKGETLKDGSIIATYAYERRYNAPPAGAQAPRPAAAVAPYKPEFLAKVKDLKDRQSEADPYTYSCKPPGLPRIGPPQQIVQGNRELAFVYSDTNGNYWRIIPTDGRKHIADADASYLGDSIGRWEGDTLVIDATNFNDDTWLSRDGTFHSAALHVTERLTRRGDSLVYEVTVEDPKVLTGPWKLQPRTLELSDARLEEAPPCKDSDQENLINLDHH